MGRSVACSYAVTGSGPAVFMVHGIGARKSIWDRLTAKLNDDFTCISFDLRGHGDSPRGELPFTLDDLVADLEALRVRLGIERAHFIGHSLGGMIIPAYARAHPEHVAALGLLSTSSFRSPEDRQLVKAIADQVDSQGIANVMPGLTGRWFTEPFLAARQDLVDWRLNQALTTPPDVFSHVFHIYADTEMSPWLHEVEAPSLVLTGEFDGDCNPAVNDQIAKALPNGHLMILKDLKHAILVEAPDRVAVQVSAFLRQHNHLASL